MWDTKTEGAGALISDLQQETDAVEIWEMFRTRKFPKDDTFSSPSSRTGHGFHSSETSTGSHRGHWQSSLTCQVAERWKGLPHVPRCTTQPYWPMGSPEVEGARSLVWKVTKISTKKRTGQDGFPLPVAVEEGKKTQILERGKWKWFFNVFQGWWGDKHSWASTAS